MRIIATLLAIGALGSCALLPPGADPGSDAPEFRAVSRALAMDPPSYAEALKRWHTADDLNAWIETRFEYDFARALKLSESQRSSAGRVQIHAPESFYASPQGVCVDLARFAVDTLRVVAPASRPRYLMIEFDPVVISGQLLRRHWLAVFEREGSLYFFADSKRPGHMAGPYPSAQAFVEDYARYRGRRIVSFRELPSHERKRKTSAPKAACEDRVCARSDQVSK